jgi:uncharacterized alpha-E superfamily protein
MLSRVAENLYWMGRYVERAENTARLVLATSQLHMEAGGKARLPWAELLRIMGLDQHAPLAALCNEDGPAIRYLTEDEDNPSALIASLHQARENARSVREMLPSEAWESLNSLYLMAKEHLREGRSDADRSQTLRNIILQRMALAGILHETMSHDVAFLFVRLGEMLERIDMTSRIIDLTTATRQATEDGESLGDSASWMNVLRALGAYPMYRRHVGVQVVPQSVVAFLFGDSHFPRSIRYCLNLLEESLGQLPLPAQTRGPLRAVASNLRTEDIHDLNILHQRIDQLQIDLGKLHQRIYDQYFALRAAPVMAAVEQPQA